MIIAIIIAVIIVVIIVVMVVMVVVVGMQQPARTGYIELSRPFHEHSKGSVLRRYQVIYHSVIYAAMAIHSACIAYV